MRVVEHIGAFAGLAAFLGLAVLALLSFAHGRDIRRLREWAGSAPERDAERKETTSAIAAQRAEELRALQEQRTAEHQAVSEREERRRRREAGLAATSRGERLRARFSGWGERLAEPRYLVGLFVVVLAIVGGVAYAALSGSGDSSADHGKQASATLAPSEVEVAVLNGTAVSGLAQDFGDKVQGKGYKLGAVTNTTSSFSSSVVMFQRGHGREASRIAKQLKIPRVQPMTVEVEGVAGGASVAVIAGEDNAAVAG
ncbi:MAG TPA: LytR C-terminal domain-containing protein [Solirubrobacterales bacterium]|nr:LytR C-terminal domain-containing protein [Solirubrobacterales bacterium]